jgi:hypothetical protein
MTETTELGWYIDGVPLNTLAWNIETRGGTNKPPSRRGSNVTVPYRPGQRFVEKTPDSRTVPLKMWVRGCGQDGEIPAGFTAARSQYDQNLSDLQRLFIRDGQVPVTKKFYESGVVRSATALCEFSDGFDTSMIGRTASRFSIDLLLADPYFYDDDYTQFNLVDGDNTIVLPGHAKTNNILLTIQGSRNNTIVRNTTLDQQVQYTGSLSSTQSAVIDVLNFTSVTNPGGANPTYDSESLVSHEGAPMWLALSPGENIINLSSTSGAGLVFLQAKGAWF